MSTTISHDVVSVFTYGLASHRAECSCSWMGKQRLFKGHATYDAYMHAALTGCRDNQPMVWDSRDYQPTDVASWRERIAAALWSVAGVGLLSFALAIPMVAFLAIPAHADPITDLTAVELAYVSVYGQPVICKTLDMYPSRGGVVGVRMAVMEDGFTDGEAQTIVAASAEGYCPARFQLVQSAASIPAISPVVKS
jgi:hypothetical protein